MVKRKKPPGMLIGIRKLRGGGEITDADDEAARLHIDADAVIAEGDEVTERRVTIFLSDGDAHEIVLGLLSSMRPSWRDMTLKFLDRDGVGIRVGRAKRTKPSKG